MRQEALIDWMREEPILQSNLDVCIKLVKEGELMLGSPPLDTEEDAQETMELLFGSRTPVTDDLGTKLFKESQKHMTIKNAKYMSKSIHQLRLYSEPNSSQGT